MANHAREGIRNPNSSEDIKKIGGTKKKPPPNESGYWTQAVVPRLGANGYDSRPSKSKLNTVDPNRDTVTVECTNSLHAWTVDWRATTGVCQDGCSLRNRGGDHVPKKRIRDLIHPSFLCTSYVPEKKNVLFSFINHVQCSAPIHGTPVKASNLPVSTNGSTILLAASLPEPF